jgi:hypothetical protein
MTALPNNYTGTPGFNGAPGNPGNSSHYNGYAGHDGGVGGQALYLHGGGTYTSSGQIQGGSGGAGGDGGAGFGVSGHGGNGGSGGFGGYGGAGVYLRSSSTLTNSGQVTGGAGGAAAAGGMGFGYGGIGGGGGAGGAGVDLLSSTLTNEGQVTGGAGGAGGYGGYAGYDGGGDNSGGGGLGETGGAGGAGVFLSGTLTNAAGASIIGGAGGNGGNGGGSSPQYYAGSGGAGGAGGAGVILVSGTLTNGGVIIGGEGGYGGQPAVYAGAAGGAGVELLLSGTLLTNSGSITGGNGAAGGHGSSAFFNSEPGNPGGAGGAGVDLSAGSVTNTGGITGGNGGAGGSAYDQSIGGNGGAGGAGVLLNGGTLTTSGTISGGVGGLGGEGSPNGSAGAAGDAVQFGSVASTLVVDSGAIFYGQVAANASVKDTLSLSGSQAGGTPITLGSQFTNFSTLTFASGAAWTVDAGTGAAPSGGLAISGFTTSDTLDVTNLTPSQVQADFTSGTHTLTTSSDGTLHWTGSFSGDAFLFSNDGSGGTDVTLVVGSALSSVLTSTVTLGSAAHKSPLTISNAGGVSPTAAGAVGVVSNISGNTLTNHGAINGGAGASASTGGTGGEAVNFKMAGTLSNSGSITGGNGGSGSAGAGGAGGAGVNLLAGTLTNTGSIGGGAGGSGSSAGGSGGAGVLLNGGTLITAGSISGGAGGVGASEGAAVKFGTAASTLVVDPGALFNGQVVANNSHDVLEIAGVQSGGTAITLGTQFTNFATLEFASGAHGTVDATKADLTAHPLTIDGFAIGDKLDITNVAAAGATLSFSTISDVLTITKGATSITLQFDSAFSGKHFVLSADGHGGGELHLQSGAGATLDASAHDLMNFVGEEHRAMMGHQSVFSPAGVGSGLMLQTDPALAFSGHGFSANAFTDHGLAHASVMLR